MKNKIILVALAIGLLGATQVSARSLTIDNNYLHQESPLYLRVSIGNHDGCSEASSCKEHHYQGTLKAEKAKMTVARDLLVTTDETLTSSSGDWGVPAEEISFDFSTPFYKGAVVKIFPDADATVDHKLTLTLKQDDLPSENVEISYQLLSPDSLDILLTTSLHLGEKLASDSLMEKMQLQVLGVGWEENLKNERFASKLTMLQKALNLEKWLRTQLLESKATNLTYMEWQTALDMIWDNAEFTPADATNFVRRYSRLKLMLDKGLTRAELVVGSLKRLLLNIEWRIQKDW